MKKGFILFLLSIYLFGCKSKIKLDEKLVFKTETITEYPILNNDFNYIDSSRVQISVKKFSASNRILQDLDFLGKKDGLGGGILYKYDKNDKLVREYLMDIHKEIYVEFEYVYVNNSRQKFEISKDGKKVKVQQDEYDNDENIIKEIMFLNDGVTIMDYRVLKYNRNNQMIERLNYNDKNILKAINLMKFDSLGLQTENKFIDKINKTEDVMTFIYETNSTVQNWKTRKCFIDSVSRYIAFRTVK